MASINNILLQRVDERKELVIDVSVRSQNIVMNIALKAFSLHHFIITIILQTSDTRQKELVIDLNVSNERCHFCHPTPILASFHHIAYIVCNFIDIGCQN